MGKVDRFADLCKATLQLSYSGGGEGQGAAGRGAICPAHLAAGALEVRGAGAKTSRLASLLWATLRLCQAPRSILGGAREIAQQAYSPAAPARPLLVGSPPLRTALLGVGLSSFLPFLNLSSPGA